MNIFELWAYALFKPAHTLKHEKKRATLVEGARNIILGSAISGLILGLIANYLAPEALATAVGPISSEFGMGLGAAFTLQLIILMPLLALISWLVVGFATYVFAKILGGKGDYVEQVYLMSMYMAPMFVLLALFAAIPISLTVFYTLGDLLGDALTIYAFYPLTIALSVTHKFSFAKAVGSWLISYVLIAVLLMAVTGNLPI